MKDLTKLPFKMLKKHGKWMQIWQIQNILGVQPYVGCILVLENEDK